jgi:uncharacterized membrane protein
MTKWFRQRFIAGLLITIPLAASAAALIWVVRFADRLTSGLPAGLIGRSVPGLGLLLTAAVVLLVGTLATNVLGRRLLRYAEDLLIRIPLFGTVYGPLKQLSEAFLPDNELGFKRVVLVQQGPHGLVLGFLTKEFTVERADGVHQPLLAVYIPTNHLYLGAIAVFSPDQVSFPELTVEQGIRIFLTGGMALPAQVAAHESSKTHSPQT